jgi:hypothetical protein
MSLQRLLDEIVVTALWVLFLALIEPINSKPSIKGADHAALAGYGWTSK